MTDTELARKPPPGSERGFVVEIRPVRRAEEWRAFAELVREYVASLPFALDFQDVDRELAHLDENYGAPVGAAFLARLSSASASSADAAAPARSAEEPPAGSAVAPESEAWLGCVGLRLLEPGVGELKRMYVRPVARGRGLGRALAEAAVEAARARALAVVRLDTVAAMRDAIGLYRGIGFAEIHPYRHNPLADARFFELSLAGDRPGTHLPGRRGQVRRIERDAGDDERIRG